ncbi:UDP-glucuronosyl/UDP-glucosyltransferase [Macleaya cordata]|uniref:Glycosyltransferase n=1 Tax=Macleaya cordata TaxID=56857 RepID=A0A200QZ31_MACCD|nr:UDP-glucuronosyl/UDP-glucosyltransferase [Macleaya cordata]
MAPSLSSSPKLQPHVVIFPFMSQGHTLPLLDLSRALSNLNLTVTIITTPSNSSQILHYISKHPNIHLKTIPFPVLRGLPTPCENTSHLPSMAYLPQFFTATIQLQEPFDQILQDMSNTGSLPICVISDFFLEWTLATCRKFNVPRIVFHGMGVLSMVISKYVWVNAEQLITESDSEAPLQLSDLNLPFTLTKADFPYPVLAADRSDPFSRFITEVGESDVQSWGVIVNSFAELENEHVSKLESFYKEAWCVGPLLLYDEMVAEDESDETIMWLDERCSGSVMYVSFGTQADVSDMQLNEIVWGLEMSDQPFICVIRSRTWTPPDGLEDKVKGRGLVVRDWVDQRRILSHRATGGFLSHCGWNSVLEGVSFGVPLLVWPMMAEQPLNAKIVVDGMGVGLWVPKEPTCREGDEIVAIKREEICEGVQELMGSEKGRKAKERAENLGRLARQSVQKDGSSYKRLNQLIDRLIM